MEEEYGLWAAHTYTVLTLGPHIDRDAVEYK